MPRGILPSTRLSGCGTLVPPVAVPDLRLDPSPLVVADLGADEADGVLAGRGVALDDVTGVGLRVSVERDREALGQLGVVEAGGEALAEIRDEVAADADGPSVGGRLVDEQPHAVAAGIHGPDQRREMTIHIAQGLIRG